jgi:hypothetical protein
MMQFGGGIVKNYNGGKYKTVNLDQKENNPVRGLLFFTEFSNPVSSAYS